MATAAEPALNPKVSIGAIFDLAFATIRRNPAVVAILALMFSAIPAEILTYWIEQLFAAEQGFGLRFWAAVLLSFGVNFAVSLIALAMLVRATIAQSEGRRAGLGESLRAGSDVLIPLLACSAVFSIAFMVGIVLLVIPAIMLAAAWAVVAPILVQERRGAIDAIRRSAELTRGARWQIFGLFLAIYIPAALLEWIVNKLGGEIDYTTLATLIARPAALGAHIAVTAVVAAASYTAQTALYIQLRDWKDGAATGHLEAVFS